MAHYFTFNEPNPAASTETAVGLISLNSQHEITAPKSLKVLSVFTPHPDSFNAVQPPHSVAGPQPLEVRVKITFHSVSIALSCEDYVAVYLLLVVP